MTSIEKLDDNSQYHNECFKPDEMKNLNEVVTCGVTPRRAHEI